ncbi:hypothetical protein KDU71_07490 [Carboxylicivirga sediminis]|uniref:Guanylate kinase/L-type calcium channel beta subunit domain-containing protein n=1 Tax=Carboxylicivirga sediminis TaxID=2006564 RepID=A0A941F3R9_9BACT|nr:hypothetical protein [Carboxylicivirga sediminis]MBR8535399.1 hypothetical protein [Carboxylicivirga sediminis]
MKKLTIAIDFDGTVCTYAQWPKIGQPQEYAKDVINKLYDEGHTIIINSLREGVYQHQAERWLEQHGINYHHFNENSPANIKKYYECRKIGADVYIDDRNINGLPKWIDIYAMIQNMCKPVIIGIVGESGSGKTMLAEHMEEKYGIKMIESRTTRPPRHEDEKGHTFVSDEEFDTYEQDDMLAFTKFGDYRYCCLKKDIEQINTYVIDEHGLKYLKQTFGSDYNIISLRIWRAEEARTKHADEERVKRDEGKFTMRRDEFDYSISNRYEMKEGVFSRANEILTEIFIRNPFYKL